MYELQAGDFGYRRKRNFNESGIRGDLAKRPSITSTGIHWPSEDTSSAEELSSNIDISEPTETNHEQAQLGSVSENAEISNSKSMTLFITPTRPSLNPQPMGQKLTIYLAPELIVKVKNLKSQRYIPSISWLVGEAIQDYLAASSEESEHKPT